MTVLPSIREIFPEHLLYQLSPSRVQGTCQAYTSRLDNPNLSPSCSPPWPSISPPQERRRHRLPPPPSSFPDFPHSLSTSTHSSPTSSLLGFSDEDLEEDIDGACDAERKHVCALCKKKFNRPSSLRIHMNTHTGATPFQCPFPNCGRLFNVNSNMRRHYRNHRVPRARHGERTAHWGPGTFDPPAWRVDEEKVIPGDELFNAKGSNVPSSTEPRHFSGLGLDGSRRYIYNTVDDR